MPSMSQSRQFSCYVSYAFSYATRPAGRRHATRLSSSM
jgi:hypothetical protein